MAMAIVTLGEAIAKGLARYFTGRPCRRQHISERKVVNGTCIACEKLTLGRWRADNADHVREYDKDYWAKNTERKAAKDRRWRQNNPEKARESDRSKYLSTDREIRLTWRRARKARVRGAPGSHTVSEVRDLLAKQKFKCAACSVSIRGSKSRHLDHIQALSRGGSNDISNLQWLCVHCNLSKHAKDPLIWAQECGRLL